MKTETGDSTFIGLVASVLGIFGTLAASWIKDVVKTNREAKRDIELAEISSADDDYEHNKKELQKALNSIKELKKELDKEKEIRNRIEAKFEAVKIAFRIIFNQYAKEFKDDIEQLSMLEELKEIIETEND